MHWGKREEEKKKSKWSEKKLYQDTISDGNKKISVLNVYIYCQWTKTISIMFWKPCQSYTKTCMLQLNCTWKKQIWYDCKEPSSHHLNLPGTSPLVTQAGPTLPWREYAQSLDQQHFAQNERTELQRGGGGGKHCFRVLTSGKSSETLDCYGMDRPPWFPT